MSYSLPNFGVNSDVAAPPHHRHPEPPSPPPSSGLHPQPDEEPPPRTFQIRPRPARIRTMHLPPPWRTAALASPAARTEQPRPPLALGEERRTGTPPPSPHARRADGDMLWQRRGVGEQGAATTA
jgi:hypothetical protein